MDLSGPLLVVVTAAVLLAYGVWVAAFRSRRRAGHWILAGQLLAWVGTWVAVFVPGRHLAAQIGACGLIVAGLAAERLLCRDPMPRVRRAGWWARLQQRVVRGSARKRLADG